MKLIFTKSLFITISLCVIVLFVLSDTAQMQDRKKDETVKQYSSMIDSEKQQFIKTESEEILKKFGRIKGDEIPEYGLARIKDYTDAYANRIKPVENSAETCGYGDDLTTILRRGKKYSYGISQSFKDKLLNPEIGIYIAMVESEFCPCLQSPTGALGMFQLTAYWGKLYGLQTIQGASPDNPDERCEPLKASKAAANYLDDLLRNQRINGNYGRDANGILLAIASYNSGDGALRKNIKSVGETQGNMPITFWTLIKNSDKMSKQFQMENMKYVPKFMAATIVGENPEVFGVSDVSALSK